jgi:hypothetical protein
MVDRTQPEGQVSPTTALLNLRCRECQGRIDDEMICALVSIGRENEQPDARAARSPRT